MIDSASVCPSLLADLESRQEDVLRRLDELNRQIEQAVVQSRLQVASAEREAGAN